MTKTPTKVVDNQVVCSVCGKQHEITTHTPGDNEGKSSTLATNLCNHQGLSDKRMHRWYCGPSAIAAHHILCTQAMKGTKWENLCRDHGYDINHWRNGIFLPMLMALACQLAVPLHKSNHDKGEAFSQGEGWIPYSREVQKRVKKIARESGQMCKYSDALIKKLNEQSKYILEKLEKFEWTLTSNGKDYRPGAGRRGCSGKGSIPVKREAIETVKAAGTLSKMKALMSTIRCNAMPRGNHGLRHGVKNTPFPIGKTITKLNVGD